MSRTRFALLGAALIGLLLAGIPALAVDWQPFPNEFIDTSTLLKGAIAAQNGTLLAKTPNFQLTEDEAEGVADILFQTKPRPPAIGLEGVRYSILTVDANGFYARSGNVGLVVSKGVDTIVL